MRPDVQKQANLLYAAAAFGFATSIIRIWFSSLNYDASWILYMAAQSRGGAVLFTDLVEVNPPLIVWLSRPALWISDAAGLSMGGGYKAWVFMLAAGSLLTSGALMKAIRAPGRALALALLAFALTWMPADQFAQREHFLVMLILPWVIMIAGRAGGARFNPALACAVALVAAIGICIKPYYVLVPAALELYLVFAIGMGKTLRRPEPYVMVAAGIAYIALVLIFTPDYFVAVREFISGVYRPGLSTPPLKVIAMAAPVLLAAGIAVMAGVKAGVKRADIAPIYTVMAIAAAALLAGYFIQFKGWQNHAYPAFAFALVPLAFAVVAIWKRAPGLKLYGVMIAAAIAGFAVVPGFKATWTRPDLVPMAEYLKAEHAADSIFIMSAKLYDGFPLVTEHDFTWGSRFPSLWMTHSLRVIEAQNGGVLSPRLQKIEDFSRAALAQDLERYKPDVILVDTPFDYIADFSKDPDFAAQFSNYEPAEWPGVYALYVRRTGD